MNHVGPFRLTRAVAGGMALRGRGLVVHVTSDAGTTAYPGWGAYGVSKAGLDHLGRIWDAELAAHGVRFLTVDPGEMDTLLVVNDAATLPASLRGRGPRGEPLELRLAGVGEGGRWTAVLLGDGDWRARTEDRPAPVRLGEGDVVTIGAGLRARVARVRPESSRLVDIVFEPEGDALWRALYRYGRPVQYSYLQRPLALWDVQTAYAGRPWAAEPPSAGRPLTWGLIAALRAAGVRTAAVTHAAGLSSTGDAALDACLPLPERSDVPPQTAAAADGSIQGRHGVTDLVIRAGYRPRVVDGILTGLHEPGSSHFALLSAFPGPLLEAAFRAADSEGYLAHEFGDSMLVLASLSAETGAISPTVSRA